MVVKLCILGSLFELVNLFTVSFRPLASYIDKQKLFDELMKDDHVLIHVDSRANNGCEVPPHLASNPALTLKLSYLFQGETTYDETAITTYLKFSGDYHRCVIPWDSIWGITGSNQQQTTWPEDIPKELLIQAAKEQLFLVGRKLFRKKQKDEKVTTQPIEAEQTTSKGSEQPAKPKKGHLRRVK